MSVKIREQRGKLYLDIYQNGARRWESLHLTLTDDKKQNKELLRLAEICRSKREAELLSGEWSIKAQGEDKMPLREYLKRYSKRYEDKKPVMALVRRLEKYKDGAGIQIGHVTQKWIEDFQDYLLNCEKSNGQKLSQSSVSDYMHILSAALRKAAAEGTISRDPTVNVSITKKTETELVFLNEDDLKKLAATIPETDYGKEIRRAFLFCCFTGLRISDLELLTWSMIERNPLQIIKRQKKTRRAVYIPLGKSAATLILDNKEHNEKQLVFDLSEHDKKKCYRELHRWVKKSGVTKKVGWHTARRTFATLTLERGADAVTVARLLGHTGLGQVMRYAKATDEMKRKAVASLPELNLA